MADVQTWCGLTHLAEVTDRLRPRLEMFHDDHGRELFDLPDTAHPRPDTPAPPRLLPEFDNAFLSHADRRRIIPDGLTFAQLTQKWGLRAHRGGTLRGTVLIDGYLDGTWRLTTTTTNTATTTIETFRQLSRDETTALTAEATRRQATVAPDTHKPHVQLRRHS